MSEPWHLHKCSCMKRRVDIAINKSQNDVRISIYRKPTFTNIIIPYSSNHSIQQKYAAIRFLYNRLNTYQLHNEDYSQEENTIHNILYINSFPIRPQKPLDRAQNQIHSPPKPTHNWATFTYIGRQTTYITKIFKHSDIKIAYHMNNTIHNHLTYDNHNHNKFSSTGIYKQTCPDCNKAYIGKKGRNFTKRYNEHKRTFQNYSHTSRFAQHLNEHSHSFGSIDNIMQILHHQKKGPHLNTTEWFYTHKEAASGNHLNDNQTIFPNRIFDAILKIQQ